jgi:hypothetical protein
MQTGVVRTEMCADVCDVAAARRKKIRHNEIIDCSPIFGAIERVTISDYTLEG